MKITQCSPGIKTRQPNDCWCVALSLALDKSYKEIRELMQPFILPSGELRGGFVDGLLSNHGFKFLELTDQLSVKKVATIFDSTNNHLVLTTKTHVIYVKDRTIYDLTKGVLKEIVEYIEYKPRRKEK